MKRYSPQHKCWEQTSAMADRGLQFGDGLFETIRRRRDGGIPLEALHLHRLERGLVALGFGEGLANDVSDIVKRALRGEVGAGSTGLKIVVTRGEGPRGYAAPVPITPAIYLSEFDAPELLAPPGISIGESHVRLGHQPLLAGFKHLNRLEQVLARQSFADGWDEALMFCQQGRLIEGCMSNVFVKLDGQWVTPELDVCGVAGVVRQWLLDNHEEITVAAIERSSLLRCEGIVMTNSLTGVRPVGNLSGMQLSIPVEAMQWQAEYMRLFDER